MAELIIAASNQNMPELEAVFGGLKTHRAFLFDAGYALPPGEEQPYVGGGFVWSEVRNISPMNVPAELAAEGQITGWHQSWRSTTLQEILRNPNPKELLKGTLNWLVLPHLNDSLDSLARLQRPLRQKLPVVVHPNEQQHPDQPKRFNLDYPAIAKAGIFATLLHQPSAETLRAWSVLSLGNMEKTVDDMLAVQPSYGLGGVAFSTWAVCADPEHGRPPLPWPVEMTDYLARRDALDELHIRLGKAGIRQALDGNLARTLEGEMLQAAASGQPVEKPCRLVLKVRARDLPPGVSAIDGNRQIIQAVVEVAGQRRAA